MVFRLGTVLWSRSARRGLHKVRNRAKQRSTMQRRHTVPRWKCHIECRAMFGLITLGVHQHNKIALCPVVETPAHCVNHTITCGMLVFEDTVGCELGMGRRDRGNGANSTVLQWVQFNQTLHEDELGPAMFKPRFVARYRVTPLLQNKSSQLDNVLLG